VSKRSDQGPQSEKTVFNFDGRIVYGCADPRGNIFERGCFTESLGRSAVYPLTFEGRRIGFAHVADVGSRMDGAGNQCPPALRVMGRLALDPMNRCDQDVINAINSGRVFLELSYSDDDRQPAPRRLRSCALHEVALVCSRTPARVTFTRDATSWCR